MTSTVLKDASGEGINVIDVGDFFVPLGLPGTTAEETKAFFDYAPDFKLRDDDVMLLSYPKTGTNWLYEVLNMLLTKSSERVKSNKVMTMIEFSKQEMVDSLPSPRVVNTHLPYRYLPKELKEKQIRTVLVLRNPKDSAVSYYNHIKGIRTYGYNGQWKDWFQLYMQGTMEYGTYIDYLKEFEKAMADGIGYPFHVLYYEDLKLNGLEEIDRLVKFLGLKIDDELKKKIMNQCSFDKMSNEKFSEELASRAFKPDFQFFRKGMVGDWMNWFTVAQNEQFDRQWEKEMSDSKFKFTYAQKNPGNSNT